MSDWKSKIQNLVEDIDNYSDNLRNKLRKISDFDADVTIIPYLGYGTSEKFWLIGRVLENKGEFKVNFESSRWDNLRNLYRQFATDEVAGAYLIAQFQDVETHFITDKEGYFDVELKLTKPISEDALFHKISLKLDGVFNHKVQAKPAVGQVLVPPKTAKFGIISDLDDTVIVTNVTNRLKMLLTVALLNEHTRIPFKGVAAFYQALQNGVSGAENNPIFYVSSSPWNLYSPLIEFLRIHNIPRGVLFLKDFGSHTVFSSGDHLSHKLNNIEKILNSYPHLSFILIGDSGEQDPEIYREVVRKYPQRIRTIYIRSVNPANKRLTAIDKLIAEIAETGCQLVLAPDTVFAAAHAAAEKLISTNALPLIREEKREEEGAPTAKEVSNTILPPSI